MIGQTLGHYRIEAQLGAGGMGVVYRARDTKLNRAVAVKVLGEQMVADVHARTRLLEEARNASALNHPHICTIHEVGEAAGQSFIVMEYVEGRPLSATVPSDGLPAERVIRYGTQIADALAHAHDRGVIHRDLKSLNVIVTPEGRTKVLDFGLAKRVQHEELEDATRSQISLTEAGKIVGTLHYLSPEALRGEPADARRDLWALGVVLYEMAAGKLPFQGQTGFQLTAAILREAAAPLPASAGSGVRAVLQRCLAKEPGERYQRAGEIRAALEAIQSDSGVVAAPRRAARSRKAAPAKPAGLRTSTGGRASANPEANRYFESAMLSLIQYDLPRMQQMLRRALEVDPHFADARAWHGLTLVLLLEGGYSNDAGLLYRAEEELRRALQDEPDSAKAHFAFALVYWHQGRMELTLEELEEALKINPEDTEALHLYAVYHLWNGDYSTVQAIEKKVMERAPLFFPARMVFALALHQQGDIAGAIQEFERILEQDPHNLYTLCLAPRSYLEAGDVEAVRRLLEQARPADRGSYWLRLNRALLLAFEGKPEEARRELDADLLQWVGAVMHSPTEIAACYALLGETAQALDWLGRAIRNGDERAEWFRRDPLLAGIRDDPRFQQLLESIEYRRQRRGRRTSG